jgi:signal transduction histidine kinase
MLSSEGNGGNQPAGWRTSDGKMWFPTIKGVAVIDANIASEDLSPPVIIEKITIDRKETPLAPTLEIDPHQENLEIEYTGINFSRPEQVKFKYRLLGLDTDWVDVGTRRTAYFPHLPPGTFTFEVVAESGDGIISPTAATLKLIVYPPFWQTWWFLVVCLSIAALFVFAVFRFRIRQLQRARVVQQDFSRHLIGAHETERRRIAAELHDGLGHSLAMIKNSTVAMTENVPRSARAQLRQITEQTAQAISEVREISYNLRPYLLDYLGLTKAIESMLSKIATSTNIEIEAKIDEIDGLFDNEVEISVYRIIQECLNNILKHAEAQKVSVVVKKHADLLTIAIHDDGKGFDQSAESTNSKPGGFGLLGIAERVEMLGGTHTIKSARGKGTTINISIGFNKAEKGKNNE